MVCIIDAFPPTQDTDLPVRSSTNFKMRPHIRCIETIQVGLDPGLSNDLSRGYSNNSYYHSYSLVRSVHFGITAALLVPQQHNRFIAEHMIHVGEKLPSDFRSSMNSATALRVFMKASQAQGKNTARKNEY